MRVDDSSDWFTILCVLTSPRVEIARGGGGGYSTDAWVGRCGPGVQTLTLFETQFSDFRIPFKTEVKIFRPYLRHLTQNHTPFKTRRK